MSVKSIITALVVVSATSGSIAMADGRDGITVRDHRTEVAHQVQSTYRQPAYPMRQSFEPAQQEPTLTCNEHGFNVLATAHLDGNQTKMDRETLDLRGVRRLDTLTFGWVYGNTSIKDVIVTYANGRSKRYYLGDSLTANKNNHVTRTIDVDNQPIRNITIIGWGWQPSSSFQILGKA